MTSASYAVVIMGVFVADVSFRAARLPNMGETFMGNKFDIGPGGKGSNQAVAAAHAGADVAFITKIGTDTFGDLARQTWSNASVADCSMVADVPTGAAMIYINDTTGDNAIILVPGAGGTLSPTDVEQAAKVIAGAKVFVTQLEQPRASALRALQIAKEAGVTCVLNPAPAVEPLDPAFYPLCDFVTPNEGEAEGLTGIRVETIDEARKAGDALLKMGVGCALLTLGERGALLHDKDRSVLIDKVVAGPVVETTGAGDAFNGAFATALAEGRKVEDAVHFACACAGLSVTKPGTAKSMPSRDEIDAVLASN